jgi:hypothetical protein
MSTAGKVLSVLVVLAALACILLTAAVAQLNHNGTKAVDDLRKDVARLEAEVQTAVSELQKLKDDTHHRQFVTQNGLTVLQARQSDVEKVRSEVLEVGSRVALQMADAEAMEKSSRALKDLRVAEKAAETKAKADKEMEVETLKSENAGLLDELTKLREKFKATLQENKGLVGKLHQPGRSAPTTRGGAGTTRTASLPR